MMPVKIKFNKETIDNYLEELADECKTLDDNLKPIKIILVGGASVLLNYNFRANTGDIDIDTSNFENLKSAINNISKKHNISDKWLNDDYKKSSSYSKKIPEVSILYKNISNVLEVRTVNSEYLVAMKLMSDRIYKHDMSDIAGIFFEHSKNNNKLNKEDIDKAVVELYGDIEKLPSFSKKLLNSLLNTEDFNRLYLYIDKRENEAKRTWQ